MRFEKDEYGSWWMRRDVYRNADNPEDGHVYEQEDVDEETQTN